MAPLTRYQRKTNHRKTVQLNESEESNSEALSVEQGKGERKRYSMANRITACQRCRKLKKRCVLKAGGESCVRCSQGKVTCSYVGPERKSELELQHSASGEVWHKSLPKGIHNLREAASNERLLSQDSLTGWNPYAGNTYPDTAYNLTTQSLGVPGVEIYSHAGAPYSTFETLFPASAESECYTPMMGRDGVSSGGDLGGIGSYMPGGTDTQPHQEPNEWIDLEGGGRSGDWHQGEHPTIHTTDVARKSEDDDSQQSWGHYPDPSYIDDHDPYYR